MKIQVLQSSSQIGSLFKVFVVSELYSGGGL